jgi:hypothetical protein
MLELGQQASGRKGGCTMSLMIRTASPIELAWNPMFVMPLIRSSIVMGRPASLLKSTPSTFFEPFGISFEEARTASMAAEGGTPGFSDVAVMLNDYLEEGECFFLFMVWRKALTLSTLWTRNMSRLFC